MKITQMLTWNTHAVLDQLYSVCKSGKLRYCLKENLKGLAVPRESNDWRNLGFDEILEWLHEKDDNGISRIQQVYSTTEYEIPELDTHLLPSIL